MAARSDSSAQRLALHSPSTRQKRLMACAAQVPGSSVSAWASSRHSFTRSVGNSVARRANGPLPYRPSRSASRSRVMEPVVKVHAKVMSAAPRP
jgi:hypothetical protein